MKAQMCLEALRPHLYRACGQHIEHFIVTRQRINHKDTKQKNAPGQHTLDIIFFREIEREREREGTTYPFSPHKMAFNFSCCSLYCFFFFCCPNIV